MASATRDTSAVAALPVGFLSPKGLFVCGDLFAYMELPSMGGRLAGMRDERKATVDGSAWRVHDKIASEKVPPC
ncbi:hypothetical protein GCM10010278_39060 [Streptomyces melanogenes]|nr:hypothetical protein GCM10010278_39060 [Streptomyces melanogenes]